MYDVLFACFDLCIGSTRIALWEFHPSPPRTHRLQNLRTQGRVPLLLFQVRILENRLDKALTKFNEALAHNKSLRQEVGSPSKVCSLFASVEEQGWGPHLWPS